MALTKKIVGEPTIEGSRKIGCEEELACALGSGLAIGAIVH